MEHESTVEWFNKELEKCMDSFSQFQSFTSFPSPNLFLIDSTEYLPNNIQVGDTVCINNPNIQSHANVGVVIEIAGSCGSYATVLFTNWNNKGAKELTFNIKNLELKEKGENNMAVTGNYDIAIVKFIQGYDTNKEYAFALFNVINPGKFVLCDTKNGYQVGQIIRIEKKAVFNGALPTAEIICQLDFSAFEARKAARAERKRLKKEMDRLIAEDRELVLYQALAEKSPAMAELLNAYKELDGIG